MFHLPSAWPKEGDIKGKFEIWYYFGNVHLF